MLITQTWRHHKVYWLNLLVVLLWLSTPFYSSAQSETLPTIEIDTDFRTLSVNQNSQSFRSNQDMQLSDVQRNRDWNSRWQSTPLDVSERLWIRTKIANVTNLESQAYLSIADPNIDIIDVFILDDKDRIVHSFLTGTTRNIDLKPTEHRHFVLPFKLQPKQEVTAYIRVFGDTHLLLPIDLWVGDAWLGKEQIQQMLFGTFVGALLVFTLYFLVTYLLLRSAVRFWFALSCLTLLFTILNIEGFIGQLTGIVTISSFMSGFLLAALMLSMVKVSRSLFSKTPPLLRYVGYALPGLIVLNTLISSHHMSTLINVILLALCVVIMCLMAIHYRNRFSSSPSRIYIIGWASLVVAASIDLYIYANSQASSSTTILLIILFSVIGILCLGVAIEAHEKVLIRFERSQQEKRIDGLNQFYQLFRNSAEGLYTSKPTGELISVNPAMWQLFGYISEDDMLSTIGNTSEFYADQNDRDVLIGELRAHKTVLGREFRGLRKDGSEFWFSLSCQLHTEAEQTFLYGSIFDVTERKQSNISLEYLATHDSLTGVQNRREFERQLQALLTSPLDPKTPMTVLYLDLDQFKVVNDTCGHKAGDALLQQLARLIDESVAQKGLLSRLGGDEFGILMASTNSDEAFILATRLLNVVSDFRFMWENKVFSLGVSIGLVERTKEIDTPEQMMSMADAACYIAKERGRNQIHQYSSTDISTKRYENELNWLAHINNALENDRFCLFYQHYQPLHEIAKGHHYELLIRMVTEDNQLVQPGAFLPAAERYSLGAKVDRWVIHHYFEWLNSNPTHNNELVACNINLCGQSLADRDFKLFVLNAFEKFSIPYSKICFEITEGMAIIKMEETLEFIKTFRQLGCTFALDDFGSGFSSYGYLKQLPVQFVKIDGAFVRDLLADPIDLAMVRSINDVAKAIGMKTVAEFVESTEIKVQLGKMGVDFAQGYGIALPAPLTEFLAFGHKKPS